MNDQTTICDALKDLGYKPEVHETKAKVRGHGSETNMAEIILKKEDISDGGDIGFAKGKDGNYTLVGDEYVIRKSENKLANVAKVVAVAYATAKAKKIAKVAGYEFLGVRQITKNGKPVQKLQFRVA
jgi:hypothetical protein